ncbi:DUF6744 family protein [Sporomusa sphaeroides]|uniref:Uncharacterized protein n=1 Tax=Sporomusa sphaeroides DSM 2875 TaxID=1337886 RepID=A0ABP2C3H2_9FIRM|nr:DUF6744 family protein [Sporomusa sphaeroides]OLS56317.1 hypothetical protein SPSPH_27100 [Sporomusa sphaeroides DSM 2875]CVK18412.1 hypothetical protein SSPH_01050 [Sporomusa sphaeroides DSM 2875]
MNNMNNLYAVRGGEADTILGNLVWFSVSDMEILRDDLVNLAANVGLPEKYVPAPIRPSDAFRRATSEVGGVLRAGEEITEVLMVREVLSSEERVVRHMIKEVRDKKNVRLNYEQIGEIEFERQWGSIKTTALSDEAMPALRKAEMQYNKYRDYFVGDHLRKMIKTVLGECQAIGVRPAGAVYFTPAVHAGTVKAMNSLVKLLPGNNAEMHCLPVINAIEQKQMLEEKLRGHVLSQVSQIGNMLGGNAEVLGVKKTLASLAAEFAATLRDQKVVSKSAASNAIQQLQGLKQQVGEYESLLEANLGEVRSTIEVLRKQVRIMLERVSVEGAA